MVDCAYLQTKEFRLVREALLEREVLLKKAPHLIHPMRFIMPHLPYLRPAWLIRFRLVYSMTIWQNEKH